MIEMLEAPTASVDQVRADAPAKATVIRVCGWCKCWMGGAPADSGLPVSHGICDPCRVNG